MASQRCSDGGEIVWDEDNARYECTICGKRKCSTCSNNLAVDEDVYCDRCMYKMEAMEVGIY